MSKKTEKQETDSKTDFVYLTWYFLEKTEVGCYLRSELKKIPRNEYEQKYAMRSNAIQ